MSYPEKSDTIVVGVPAANAPRVGQVSFTDKQRMIDGILRIHSMDSLSRAKALIQIAFLFDPDTQNQLLPPGYTFL